MNPQKGDMTTRPALERLTEDEDNQWTLGSPMIISKMGSLSTSTVISMATWQKNAKWKRRNEKHEHVSNVTRRGILPKIVKGNRR